jgi:hypothetical protein
MTKSQTAYIHALVNNGKIPLTTGLAWLALGLRGAQPSGMGACSYGCPGVAQAQTIMQPCGCPTGAQTQQEVYATPPGLPLSGLGQVVPTSCTSSLIIGGVLGAVVWNFFGSAFSAGAGLGTKAIHHGVKKAEKRLET